MEVVAIPRAYPYYVYSAVLGEFVLMGLQPDDGTEGVRLKPISND